LTLTGHLGDVMKESAQAALSYARSKSREFNLDPDFYEKLDVPVHVPAGAIPKDGPSAGVTMATSLISSLTRIPIRKDIAMTGEITLRGRVLPVGGIKEKTLAALRAKIKTLILPYQNQKDLEEIPPYIRRKVNYVFVKGMDEILKMALVPEKSESAPGIGDQEPGEKKGRADSVSLSLPV
jgi:ATP-dependent Lon protease